MQGHTKKNICLVTGVGGASALIAMAALTGCGAGGDIKGFTIECENQYQYQPVNVEDISVKKGNKDVPLGELDVAYVFSTPSYSGESFSMYIDGELYETTLPNYVKAESISWTYDGESYVPDNITDGVLPQPGIVEGSFVYTDGTTWDCTAEYVTVTRNGESYDFCIVSGDTTYYASFPAQLGVRPATQPEVEGTVEGTVEGETDETAEGENVDESRESEEGENEGESTDSSETAEEPEEGTESSATNESKEPSKGSGIEPSESVEEADEERPGSEDSESSESSESSEEAEVSQ